MLRKARYMSWLVFWVFPWFQLKVWQKGFPKDFMQTNVSSLIGQGMRFYTIKKFTTVNPTKSLDRFQKDLHTKAYYTGGRPQKREDVFISKMHVDSDWEPKEWDIPTVIIDYLFKFSTTITSLFRKKRREENDVLPFQHLALKPLALRTDIVISCDKNI